MGEQVSEAGRSLLLNRWWVLLLLCETLVCLVVYAVTGGRNGLILLAVLGFVAACLAISFLLSYGLRPVQR